MRFIAPIFIEASNIVILNINDVEGVKNSDKKTYIKMLISGDLERFYYGYNHIAERDKCVKEKKGIYVENNGFVANTDIFVGDTIDSIEKDRIELVANSYKLKSLESKKKIEIIGYQRQKSIFEITTKELAIKSDAYISYVTFKSLGENEKIVVKSGTKAVFKGVVFDGVELVIEDGAEIELTDVLFVEQDIAVKMLGSSTISKAEHCVFESVRVRYWIEKAAAENIKPIVDIYDSVSLANFIETSHIKTYLLESDLVFAKGNGYRFTSPVEFVNINGDKPINIRMIDYEIESDLIVGEGIILDGDLRIVDQENLTVSLSNYTGRLTIENSHNIKLLNCAFRGMDNLEFDIKGSRVVMMGVIIEDKKVFARVTKSELTMINIYANKIDERLIDIKKNIKESETVLLENDENKIYIKDSLFNGCKHIAFDMEIDELAVEGTKTVQCGAPFRAKHLTVNSCEISLSTIGVVAEGSMLKVINSKIGNCDRGVYVQPLGSAQSKAILEDVIIENCNTGLEISNSQALCSNVVFKKNETPVHLRKGRTLLINNGITLFSNTRSIIKEHGAEVKDAENLEELANI